MAKKNVKKRKKSYLKIGNYKIKKRTATITICVLIGVVIFSLFRASYLWPWPSQSEIDQRLIDVVDACIYNEGSRACNNLQKRYNMSFEYCHALSDIPEIGVSIPIYGVARKNDFTASSLNYVPRTKTGDSPTLSTTTPSTGKINKITSVTYTMVPMSGIAGDSKYPYYGCVESIDEITRQKGSNLISNPETIALFGLSKIPQYSETYEPQGQYGCMFHRPGINNLWNQIPNISVIRNEADNIFNMYPKCSMRADIDRSINELNAKLNAYANNYSVQLFYQKYDEWNTRDWAKCTWYEESFTQRCGAGSDGSTESAGYGSMVKDFTDEMQQYLHTEYFTSKIVVSD